jgi:hypothetical protein
MPGHRVFPLQIWAVLSVLGVSMILRVLSVLVTRLNHDIQVGCRFEAPLLDTQLASMASVACSDQKALQWSHQQLQSYMLRWFSAGVKLRFT